MRESKDLFYLRLAKLASTRSKDPSTQTGAVVVNGDLEFLGYNGFPRGTDDSPDIYANRDLKLSKVIHCEMNACIKAGNHAKGATLYTWPFMSCDRCAAHMVQYGIVRAVAPKLPQHLEERWKDSIALSRQYFKEAGIELLEIDVGDLS